MARGLKSGRRWLLAAAAVLAPIATPLGAAQASGPSLPSVIDALLALPSASRAAPAASAAPPASSTDRPVLPFYGNLNPFYGNLNPFYGNLNPFYGNLNPFYGNLNPFWGNLNPFWGNLNPFWGNLNPFWGNLNPFYGDMTAYADSSYTYDGRLKPQWSAMSSFWTNYGTSWQNITSAWRAIDPNAGNAQYRYAAIAQQLQAMVDSSQSFWGAAVRSQSGQSFMAGFGQALLDKYGIDLDNPSSLANLSEGDRQMFFLDWYDGLMNYSGADHPDWWMKAVNWTPALTMTLGQGARATIGLLDFSITGDPGIQDNVVKYDGISTFSNGHGTAVASLMVSPMDGKGVMGIAPNAAVVAYNPFDSTGTASWADVSKGIQMLAKNGATVVNMSLGVPGWTLNPGWNQVFSDAKVSKLLDHTVFVIAAGNEGVSQTQNVSWNFARDPAFLIVGSVDPAGNISSFSNRPGTACLTNGSSSKCADPLMNHFIVAPGELILVSDGQGGVTRETGTSFAAPLVSGTIALMQGRWPWLANYPDEEASIILKTAKDLGAPGIDPVYGAGELDVTAAMSPIDMNKLLWFRPGPFGTVVPTTAKTIQQPNQVAKWQASGVYFYAFENIGATFRDFAIPLSSRLVGQKVTAADGTPQYLQDYLTSRTIGWINTGKGFAGQQGFASFTERGGTLSGSDVSLTMALAPKTQVYGYRQSTMPYQGALRLGSADGRTGFRMGFGDGAVALGGQTGFGLISDYDAYAGGVNPLLGMASGSAYANADVALTRTLSVSTGYTNRDMHRDRRLIPFEELTTLGAQRDSASAQTVSLTYTPIRALSVIAAYTRLEEDGAVLGVRSIDPQDFGRGSISQGVTLGATLDIGHGLSLAGSATRSRTGDRGGNHALSIADGGIVASAYEFAFAKEHVLDGKDRVRFALSQPMHIERGSFDFSSVQVIDRSTGELGVVDQQFDAPGAPRQYVGEMLYARPFGRFGEISLFGRAQLRRDATPEGSPRLMAGTRLTIGF